MSVSAVSHINRKITVGAAYKLKITFRLFIRADRKKSLFFNRTQQHGLFIKAEFGIDVLSLGIRDLILPGEMKDLMNKVIEAKKAADANLIMRREETAAMRSQANTARILENNPTLMRLRELDVLEKVAGNSKLNVVLGEKGLADRIVNLL